MIINEKTLKFTLLIRTMFKPNNILLLILTMIIISSCEEDYVLQRAEYKPKIVVNSIFKPGENWVVRLSSSQDFLEKESKTKYLENALVTIIDKSNNRHIRLYPTENGKYISTIHPPLPDHTYELLVEAEGYESVVASSKAPLKANVVNVITSVIDKEFTTVNFEIKDNTSNYLIWNFINSGPKNEIDSSFTGNSGELVTGIIKYNNINKYLTTLTDTDNNAITQEGSFTGSIRNQSVGTTIDTTINVVTKKYLRLMTASVDLYNYFKTVEKFVAADNHNSSFSYSPKIYSNIKNGLGIFAGYTEEYKEIK